MGAELVTKANGRTTSVPTNIWVMTCVADDFPRSELARPKASLRPMVIAAAIPRRIDTAEPYFHPSLPLVLR